MDNISLRQYLHCEYRPFGTSKHKCLRCRDVGVGQYEFCRDHHAKVERELLKIKDEK